MEHAPLNEIEMQENSCGPETLLKSQLQKPNREKELLRMVTAGQFDAVKQILQPDSPAVDVNCSDALGRTPLMLAAANGQVNKQMVQLLVKNGANTESALLFAVRQANIQALRILLPYRPKIEDIPNQRTCFKDLGYITPLMLASKLGNYEMVTLFISHGDEVLEHHIKCSCVHCNSAETIIARSLIRLESYKALSNPVYIAAQYVLSPESVKDPIKTAFVLSKKLRQEAASDYEFKDEYLSLCKALNDFPVKLLSECQNIEEMRMVMEIGKREEREEPAIPVEAKHLSILDAAIENQNEKFIAHPFSQLMLNYEVYRKYPEWKNTSLLTKYFMILLLTAIFPVWTFCYLFLPNSHVTQLLRTPLLKYAVFLGSYHVFLLLVSLTVFQSQSVFLKFGTGDFLVLVYIIGYCLDIGKEIYRSGWKRYFSNWYSYVLVAMVTSFLLYYVIWTAGYISLRHKCPQSICPDPSKVKPFTDAILCSYIFYSFGILLSFLYFLSTFHCIPTLGPLLMSLLTMLRDVANFFMFFLFLFVAFVFSLSKLYWQYQQAVNNEQFAAIYNATHLHLHKMTGIKGSIKVIFWSLFGRVKLGDFELTQPGFNIIGTAALVIFGMFNVLAVLVALNMLIAMLNESFSQVASVTDIKWKYSRTKMLFSLIYKSNVLPPPLNLIPTPRAVLGLFKTIIKVCCRQDECCATQYFNGNRMTIRAQLRHQQRRELIGRLVLRHLSSTERSKNSTTLTVEKLHRASQDLSSGMTSRDLSSDVMPWSAATEGLEERGAVRGMAGVSGFGFVN